MKTIGLIIQIASMVVVGLFGLLIVVIEKSQEINHIIKNIGILMSVICMLLFLYITIIQNNKEDKELCGVII